MYSLTDESIKVINDNLERNYLFHINSFPIEAALQDGGCIEKEIASLSGQWLYDRYGFFSTFENYNTFHKRLTEFTDHGDYLKTLRQRINIIHEMIKCDMNSNLPVHISVMNRTDKKVTLDLQDRKLLNNFSFIAHPGQTRVQGSIFLRDPLKNVILYISKKNMQTIDIKKDSYITPILSVDELVKFYRTFKPDEKKLPVYDFKMPYLDNNMKYHAEHDTYILKVNNIQDKKTSELKLKTSFHASTFYLPDTFFSMNNFCKIFFNNHFNIYTDKKEVANKYIVNGESKILYKAFTTNNSKKLSRTLLADNFSIRPCDGYNYTIETNYRMFKDNLTNDELTYLNYYLKLFTLSKKPNNSSFNFKLIEIDNIEDYKKIVTLNNNKGICVVMKSNLRVFERNIFELLFCIPDTYTLTRNNDNSLCIINCEHEYWKTGENMKEYVLTDNFFKT